MRRARLILEDGTEFFGSSFGYEAGTRGEVVFNTAMTGYPESLTDPSYAGQILVTTYPLIGNYGVPDTGLGSDGLPLFMESNRIHAKALVVADYSEQYSHWNARESLSSWLKRERVPGITGIDTRRLTKVLREHGVMMGQVLTDGDDEESLSVERDDYGRVNWVEQVSCKEVITYPSVGEKRYRVVLVDCGVKANIIRCLIKRGIDVVRVPWDYDFNDYGRVRKEKESRKVSNGVFFVLFMLLAMFLIIAGIFILPYGWILIVGGIFVFIWGLLLTFM